MRPRYNVLFRGPMWMRAMLAAFVTATAFTGCHADSSFTLTLPQFATPVPATAAPTH